MTFIEKLADNLRDARSAKGMTQQQLAQQIGVTPTCISMYENAKRMPNLEMISMMSNVLDVSLDDLIPYALHEVSIDPCQTTIFNLIGE